MCAHERLEIIGTDGMLLIVPVGSSICISFAGFTAFYFCQACRERMLSGGSNIWWSFEE